MHILGCDQVRWVASAFSSGTTYCRDYFAREFFEAVLLCNLLIDGFLSYVLLRREGFG